MVNELPKNFSQKITSAHISLLHRPYSNSYFVGTIAESMANSKRFSAQLIMSSFKKRERRDVLGGERETALRINDVLFLLLIFF